MGHFSCGYYNYNTHEQCAYVSSQSLAPCSKLSFRSSFNYCDHFGVGELFRIVYLAGYWFACDTQHNNMHSSVIDLL